MHIDTGALRVNDTDLLDDNNTIGKEKLHLQLGQDRSSPVSSLLFSAALH